MSPRTPDPRPLGQMLVMQGCIQLMDSDERVFAMVSRGLSSVPGIASVAVRLVGNPWTPPPSSSTQVEVPIETLHENFGRLFIELSDAGEFAIYEPFVRNLAGTIALWLESHSHHRQLQAAMEQLEVALRQRSEALAEARCAAASREAILGIVSHDLANPLGAILNMVAAVKGHPEQTQTVMKAVEVIDRSAWRMNRMIRDLLDLASIDAGRVSIERAPNDLRQLLSQTLEELRSVASEKEIAVEVRVEDDLPLVACDGHRIVQVLSNLLGNAFKFTPRGGAVKVLVERRGAELLVAVEDTGPGIPEEDLPHLFERFYRSKHARERGTGLGLAIAKAIIDLHQGKLWVESKLAAGSRFSVLLPLGGP